MTRKVKIIKKEKNHNNNSNHSLTKKTEGNQFHPFFLSSLFFSSNFEVLLPSPPPTVLSLFFLDLMRIANLFFFPRAEKKLFFRQNPDGIPDGI